MLSHIVNIIFAKMKKPISRLCVFLKQESHYGSNYGVSLLKILYMAYLYPVFFIVIWQIIDDDYLWS